MPPLYHGSSGLFMGCRLLGKFLPGLCLPYPYTFTFYALLNVPCCQFPCRAIRARAVLKHRDACAPLPARNRKRHFRTCADCRFRLRLDNGSQRMPLCLPTTTDATFLLQPLLPRSYFAGSVKDGAPGSATIAATL